MNNFQMFINQLAYVGILTNNESKIRLIFREIETISNNIQNIASMDKSFAVYKFEFIIYMVKYMSIQKRV